MTSHVDFSHSYKFKIVINMQGMCASMTGPTTPDLRDRLGVDMETLSFLLAFKSLGTPVGAIVSGMLSDR